MLEGLDWQKELNCTLTGRFCWPIFGASRLRYQAIAAAMNCRATPVQLRHSLCYETQLTALPDFAQHSAKIEIEHFCHFCHSDFYWLISNSLVVSSLWLHAQRSGCDFVFPRFASSGAEQRGQTALCHPASPNKTTECSECIVAIAWKAAAKPSGSHKLVTSCYLSWPCRPFHCSWVSISCRSQKAVVEPRQNMASCNIHFQQERCPKCS